MSNFLMTLIKAMIFGASYILSWAVLMILTFIAGFFFQLTDFYWVLKVCAPFISAALITVYAWQKYSSVVKGYLVEQEYVEKSKWPEEEKI